LAGHPDDRAGTRFGGAEGARRGGAEVTVARPAGAVGQVERDVVPAHVEQSRPLDSLPLAEVAYSTHVRVVSIRRSRAPAPSAVPGPPEFRTRTWVPRSGPLHRGVQSRVPGRRGTMR